MFWMSSVMITTEAKFTQLLWINYSILLQIRKVFFSFSTFSTLPPAFQPPLCCTVSALEIEISSPNCGRMVSQESELLSSHLFHFSHHSRHDKWAARVCLSLSLLMAAPLSGVPLSSHWVSFLIHHFSQLPALNDQTTSRSETFNLFIYL